MRPGAVTELDVRHLQLGDAVEVFIDSARGWCRGYFDITTAGVAVIELPGGERIQLGDALLLGIRAGRARPTP